MAINYQVLGTPEGDNALWVTVDSGQSLKRLLFDCGQNCLGALSRSEIQQTDHLFFSHIHLDHVAGFDEWFRCVFNRETQANQIWGPPGSGRIFHHRLRGYWWNLVQGLPARWLVHDVHPDEVISSRFELQEGFENRYDAGTRPHQGTILEETAFTVEAVQLDHHGPCLGYLVREPERVNVDQERLRALELVPGPWLEDLKRESDDPGIVVAGEVKDRRGLRAELLVRSKGSSLAYLTDFLLDESTRNRLADWIQGVDTVVCESEYRQEDAELSLRNHHTTNMQVAELARQAGVGKLVLFHISDRYSAEERQDLLRAARTVFPETHFPPDWAG
jgi:ribonuclease Z